MNTTTVPSAPPLTEFVSVSKWYGPVMAVNGVSFQLPPGVTGLVGPNGAGKSTLIKLLTGQLRPSLGRVRIRGAQAWSVKAKRWIGYCPDADAFYEEMSGRAFVRTVAGLHGFRRRAAGRRCDEVLELVGMTRHCDRPLRTYSKGMRQRIKLAQALVHDPDLLVLDEPLNGVDPVGRVDFVTVFRQLAAAGKAILVSSHVLEEMDKLADQVLFLCRGRLVASGPLSEIRALLEDHPLRIRLTASRARELAAQLVRWDLVQAVDFEGRDGLLVHAYRPRAFFAALTELVVQEQFEIERMQVRDASTEAVFHYLMSRAVHGY